MRVGEELRKNPCPSPLFSTTDYNSIVNAENVLKPDLECSSCKELYSENRELKEALAKASQLTTADKVVSAYYPNCFRHICWLVL